MVIDTKNYVPTLAVRPSEMNGLEYLPQKTKDNMTPCFLLAPWGRAETLDKTIDRIERAFPKGPYFLDIDRDYQFSNLDAPAQQQLSRLMNPAGGYSAWAEFISEHQRVMPCLQLRDQDVTAIRQQIGFYQDLGRYFCLRVFRNRDPSNIVDAVIALNELGTADYAVILEGGWAQDVLQLPMWYQGYITGPLRDIRADVPIVTSSTSIPKVFADIEGSREVPFGNRRLIEQLRPVRNQGDLIYGDWASTKPRAYQAGGGPVPPRIDYAQETSWWFFRNTVEDWSYSDAAQHLIAKHDVWDGGTGQWAELMIAETAVNQSLGINSPQKNVACRVNLHLHRQAFFGGPPPPPSAFEEDWEDI